MFVCDLTVSVGVLVMCLIVRGCVCSELFMCSVHTSTIGQMATALVWFSICFRLYALHFDTNKQDMWCIPNLFLLNPCFYKEYYQNGCIPVLFKGNYIWHSVDIVMIGFLHSVIYLEY